LEAKNKHDTSQNNGTQHMTKISGCEKI